MPGFVTVDEALVLAALRKELGDGADEAVLEYLGSMIAQCDEPGEGGSALVEQLAPFIESYGCAESDEAAQALARRLLSAMLSSGALSLRPSAKQAALAVERDRRRTAVEAAAREASEQAADGDTWGVKDVAVKYDVNSVVDSISDALGNKKSLEKLQKKQEKERLKEEARLDREEAERARGMAEMDLAPPPPPIAGSGADGPRTRDVLLSNLNISVGGGKLLLEDADLRIVHGRKYGLIGKNGTGKTTLLKHISRRLLPGFPAHLSIVHVEQEVVGDDTRVVDYLLSKDVERLQLLAREKALTQALEQAAAGSAQAQAANDKLRALYDEMASAGIETAEPRARMVLTGLGFTPEMQMAPTKSLSGGWRMRVAIASALFLSPDLLLLDEPTNHLDVTSVLFLERYLQDYKKTLVLVSHDRVFTNNVITDVVQLEHKKLNYYKGDIDVFEQTRENVRLQQERAHDAQQSRRAHMQKFIDRFRYNAKRASMAQSRIKALNKMVLVPEVLDDPEFTFSFPEPVSELDKCIEVQGISFAYAPRPGIDAGPPKQLFSKADMSIFSNSRMVLLGPNGCGKSTFIKCLLDKLQPTEGWVQRDPKLQIGYFAQHHVDQLNVRMTPLDYMLGEFPGSKPEDMRPHLARYGIPAELALQRIGTLSGGQKSRVAFAKITWHKPHLLICDEPSNHLDLETNAALSLAINTFDGGVLLVTHDQYLIEMTAEEFWVMHEGKLSQFKGTFQEYKKWALPDPR